MKYTSMRYSFVLGIALLGSSACAAPIPASFPSVSPAVQQERDAGRREILTSELADEQAALTAARAATPINPRKVHDHELNVAALLRELGVASALRVKVRALPTAPMQQGDMAARLNHMTPEEQKMFYAKAESQFGYRPAGAPPSASAPQIEDPAPFWDVYRRVTLSTNRKEAP